MGATLKGVMIGCLSALLLAPAGVAYANRPGNPTGGHFAKNHPRRNQVNQRVKNQRGRINQGVKSGKLSRGQARQLRRSDNRIKAQEHRDVKANGGYLTKGEQHQLNHEENANSQRIYDEKH